MASIFCRGLQFFFVLHINNHVQSGQRYVYPHIVWLRKKVWEGTSGQEKLAGMHFRIPLQPSGTGLCALLGKS